MKILLLGGYGMLGSEIYNNLYLRGYDIVRYKSSELNLLNKDDLKKKIEAIKPNIVIHAAGYTNVLKAESDLDNAFKVNCIGIYNLVSILKNSNSKLIYFSTDYIFDGEKKLPYNEEEEGNPLNNYGWTKLVADDIIRANYDRYYIIRVSWLFGPNSECFPAKIIAKARMNEKLRIVEDQFGCPTYTLDVASTILTISKLPYGIYNMTNGGCTTWYEFAKQILNLMNFKDIGIQPIKSIDLGKKVIRPRYSVLDNSKIHEAGIRLRSHEEALKEFINNYYKNI